MKLYEITQEIWEITKNYQWDEKGNTINPETGEVDIKLKDQLFSELSELKIDLDDKVESIYKWIRNLESEAKMIKEEKDRLAKAEKIRNNKIQSMKNYLAMNIKKGWNISTSIGTVYTKTTESVQLINEEAIPEQFVTVRTERKISKKDLKPYLKLAMLIENKEHLEGELEDWKQGAKDSTNEMIEKTIKDLEAELEEVNKSYLTYSEEEVLIAINLQRTNSAYLRSNRSVSIK